MTPSASLAPSDRASGRELSLQQQRVRSAFWFLAPMVIALIAAAAWPLLRTIYFSMTNTTLSSLYEGCLLYTSPSPRD